MELETPRTLSEAPGESAACPIVGAAGLAAIPKFLRNRTYSDFSEYERVAVERRILLSRVETLGDDARVLVQSPEEIDPLFQDLLIRVSAWRNSSAITEEIEIPCKKVLEPLLTEHTAIPPTRVRASGCAGGGVVYSNVGAVVAYDRHQRSACNSNDRETD